MLDHTTLILLSGGSMDFFTAKDAKSAEDSQRDANGLLRILSAFYSLTSAKQMEQLFFPQITQTIAD